VSNDVGAPNAHVFHERATVRGLLRKAYRGLEMGAAGESPPMFQKHLAVFRQRYLLSYTTRGVWREGWHRLQVRLKSRRGTVTARAGYMAGT
jgi:hypothetical protein